MESRSESVAGSFAALHTAVQHALEHLEQLDRRPVGASAELELLRQRLGGAVPEFPTPAQTVIEDLVAATKAGLHGCAGARFFAWVVGGVLHSALAADWLTSAWDQNAAMYSCAPAAAVVEEVVGDWLKDLLGLPSGASFALTTGCQLAHFTCLAAARYAVLERAGWNVNEHGLFGAPPVQIYTSDQRHGSVDRALRFLGFGDRSVTHLPTDEAGGIACPALRRVLADRTGPAIVVLHAADLNIGAFDHFDEVIPLARAAGAWVHVDGAFGLMARASPNQRSLTAGIEQADSWATDGHKWLNVPYDNGFAFVRERAAHRASMTISASYLAPDDRARDQIDWNPEWSRRARGFAVYAALRELGRSGLAALIDRCCEHAHAIVSGIASLPGAEALWTPTLNQGLVRFRDPRPGASDREHDERTDRVIAAVNATGAAYFSGTTWRGRRAMRVSVVNWRTTPEDVRRTRDAVATVLKEMDGPRRAGK